MTFDFLLGIPSFFMKEYHPINRSNFPLVFVLMGKSSPNVEFTPVMIREVYLCLYFIHYFSQTGSLIWLRRDPFFKE